MYKITQILLIILDNFVRRTMMSQLLRKDDSFEVKDDPRCSVSHKCFVPILSPFPTNPCTVRRGYTCVLFESPNAKVVPPSPFFNG